MRKSNKPNQLLTIFSKYGVLEPLYITFKTYADILKKVPAIDDYLLDKCNGKVSVDESLNFVLTLKYFAGSYLRSIRKNDNFHCSYCDYSIESMPFIVEFQKLIDIE